MGKLKINLIDEDRHIEQDTLYNLRILDSRFCFPSIIYQAAIDGVKFPIESSDAGNYSEMSSCALAVFKHFFAEGEYTYTGMFFFNSGKLYANTVRRSDGESLQETLASFAMMEISKSKCQIY